MLIREIPELKIDNASILDAAKIALEKFRLSYPNDNRLRGVIVGDEVPISLSYRVSVDFKKIPIGLAFRYIADSASAVLSEHDGVISIVPVEVGLGKNAIHIVAGTDRVKKLLNLPDKGQVVDTLPALKRLGIREDSIFEANYYPEQNAIFIKGYAREIGFLRNVIELVERGVGVTLKEEGKAGVE